MLSVDPVSGEMEGEPLVLHRSPVADGERGR